MPFPKKESMNKMWSFLKKDKPGMPRKKKIAIALKQTGKSKFKKKIKVPHYKIS